MKPVGRYVMVDLYRVGGIPAVTKALLDAGFLHGDFPTVTGKTVAENLADPPPGAEADHPGVGRPIVKTAGSSSSRGPWLPKGQWRSWQDSKTRRAGTARVFDGEAPSLTRSGTERSRQGTSS